LGNKRGKERKKRGKDEGGWRGKREKSTNPQKNLLKAYS
jgi:hypothetical protein